MDIKGKNTSTALEGSNYDFPPTYIVIQFEESVPYLNVKWIIDKIKGPRNNGGADLLIRKQPATSNGIILHVSASLDRLLEAAEDLEIRKKDKRNVLRPFSVSTLEDFIENNEELNNFLTTAECQYIVRHELASIRALALDKLPELSANDQKFYEGQSIIEACLHWKILRQIFPLHEVEILRKLGSCWFMQPFKGQPYDDIHSYFGEGIALYFHFLGFYNSALILPVLLGFYQMFCSTETLPFFCFFNVLWATGFIELWKVKSSELAYKWGTITTTSLDDEPRPNYNGVFGIDEVTGRVQPKYPQWKVLTKMYCVSLPIVLVCMIGAFVVMLLSFWLETKLKNIPQIPKILTYMPSIIYCGLINIMNMYYRKLADYLTEWENHKTQSQFDRYRVTKLILFEFINNFMSLFYIAFYIQDLEMLRTQLATMLVLLQVIFNIKESLLPFFIKLYDFKIFKSREQSTRKDKIFEGINSTKLGIEELNEDDSRVQQVFNELKLQSYEGTYDDYLELFVQFGYVFLFAAVFPMAAFWAFLNNFIEIRSDAFKLCMVYQRPIASKVKDIGAWQKAFEALCAMSVMTNCALLYMSPVMKEQIAQDMKPVKWFAICVAFEHIIFIIRQILHFVIPEKPRYVKIALAKINYESRQMLKKQRLVKNQRKLSVLYSSLKNI